MCPVCRARFRGSAQCSRCGADLTTLMTLLAWAWRSRREARLAIARGDFAHARDLALKAQKLSYTPEGRNLEGLSVWLARNSEKENQ